MLVSVDHEFDNFCVCVQCSAIREGLKTEEYYQRLDRFITAANTMERWRLESDANRPRTHSQAGIFSPPAYRVRRKAPDTDSGGLRLFLQLLGGQQEARPAVHEVCRQPVLGPRRR